MFQRDELRSKVEDVSKKLEKWEEFTKKWLWMTPEELTALGELIREKLREQIKETDKTEQTKEMK